MPRQIRLTFDTEGVSAVADLLEDLAPRTCVAVWAALPVTGEAHHAIYSGSECVLVLSEVLRLEPENASADVVPGDVGFTWFAAGSSAAAERDFAEICWFYDRDARPSMPEGPVPVSRFARIREGGEAFYAVCRRMRREGVKPLTIARVEPQRPSGFRTAEDAESAEREGREERVEARGRSAASPTPSSHPSSAPSASSAVRYLARRFVAWQTPYGRPDPARCPFVTPGRCISTQFHSPTFLAIGLYRAFEATDDPALKAAADRYVTFFFSCLRDPPAGGQRLHYPSYPFQYGMGLAAYREFRRHNPDETSLDGKAAAGFEWLLRFRWEEGSYFRNSYGSPRHGVVDCANSDDNLHIGRGLMGYYAVSGRPEALAEAEGLAGYYLTEARLGSYQGCWSPALGTWVVAPTAVDGIEHFRGRRSIDMGWGFSSTGAIDYLCQLAAATSRSDLRAGIAAKCAASMKWQFDACQFEDGACGMRGRDDRWLGMTAGAILSFLRTRDAGFLSETDVARFGARARAAGDWLRAHVTPRAIDAGGYFRVTGESEPRPPENLAWLLGWTLEALVRLPEIALEKSHTG